MADKSTRWSFTAYESQFTLFKDEMDPLISEYGYQEEVCPTTNRKHYQGYLRTARQVRLTQLVKLFPGVHLEIARDWFKLVNYCKKKDTAVEGTQKVFKNQVRYKQMFEYLQLVAENADTEYIRVTVRLYTRKFEDGDVTADEMEKKIEQAVRRCYWRAVNKLLEDNPQDVSQYTNPQFERAFVKTYDVWLLRLNIDEY
jgi:hypothetical protein